MREPDSVKVAGKCDGTVDECQFKVTKVGGSASGQGVSGLTKAIKTVSGGEPADIPAALGSCKTVKKHDDGDLTVRCGGDLYVVTTEGKAFKQVALKETLEAPPKLLTKDILAKIPKLYGQENEDDPMVYIKFFHPMSSWTWYATEYDPNDRLFFGWSPVDDEMGYASYDEIAKVKVRGLGVERDLYFTPKRLSEVKVDEHIPGYERKGEVGGQGKLFEKFAPKLIERKNGKIVKHYRNAKGMHPGSIRIKTLPTGAQVYLGCPTDEPWRAPSSCARQVVLKTVTPIVHHMNEVDPEIQDAIVNAEEVKVN